MQAIQINAYSFILLVAGSLCMLIALVIILKHKASTWFFGIVMFLISVWAIFYGLELMQTRLSAMYFFIQIEYIGISFLPAFWIAFIIKYTGQDHWLTNRNFALLLVIPLITLLMVITNPWHQLYYESLSKVDIAGFSLLQIDPGPWYKIHTAYFYMVMLMGGYLLFRHMQYADVKYKQQNLTLFLSSFFPWLANILYLSGVRIFQHIDITPLAFMVTGLSISLGLVRYSLFELIPIARDRVVQNMRDGLLIIDEKNRILDFNDRMETILNLNKSLFGLNASQVFKNENQFLFSLQTESVDKIEVDFNNHYYEVNISPVFTSAGNLRGRILLFRDISRYKEYTEKMQEQAIRMHKLNNLKDKLLSVISHDIRGPISNLKQIMAMVNDKLINEQEFRELMPLLNKSLGETSLMLDNLLHWSRNQIKGYVIDKENIDLHHIAESTLAIFSRQAEDKQIRLVNNIPEGQKASGERDIIDIVLRNLISNAVKFSFEKGLVSIDCEENEHMLVISISDIGIGMDSKVQQRILNNEIFTEPGTGLEKGAGIGISLCKEFLGKIGGSFWLRSVKGEGTTFYFNLEKAQEKVNA